MKKLGVFGDFIVYRLTKELADKYSDQIVSALDLIPQVDKHKKEYVLAESKNNIILHRKWDHSLIALTKDNHFAGVIIGYEREAEGNDQYPDNCIYLSDLAVITKYQGKGLGKFLCNLWLEDGKNTGFKDLSGKIKLCVQTNKADWNKKTQTLYESLGFRKVSEKIYENRIDNVYSL